jgi:hypothetical protein
MGQDKALLSPLTRGRWAVFGSVNYFSGAFHEGVLPRLMLLLWEGGAAKCCGSLPRISKILPNSAVIADAGKIADMVWLWEVFGYLISPES